MNFIATASERVFVLKWKRNRGNKKTNWLLGVSLKVEWACVLRFKNRHRLKPERRCTTLWSYLPPLYYCCCCCCYSTLVWCGVWCVSSSRKTQPCESSVLLPLLLLPDSPTFLLYSGHFAIAFAVPSHLLGYRCCPPPTPSLFRLCVAVACWIGSLDAVGSSSSSSPPPKKSTIIKPPRRHRWYLTDHSYKFVANSKLHSKNKTCRVHCVQHALLHFTYFERTKRGI